MAAPLAPDLKQILWQDVTSDKISEWKVICHESHSNLCGKSRATKIAVSTSNTSVDVATSNIRTFCYKSGFNGQRCFVNPDSPNGRLRKNSKRALKVKYENKRVATDPNKRTFGGLASISFPVNYGFSESFSAFSDPTKSSLSTIGESVLTKIAIVFCVGKPENHSPKILSNNPILDCRAQYLCSDLYQRCGRRPMKHAVWKLFIWQRKTPAPNA